MNIFGELGSSCITFRDSGSSGKIILVSMGNQAKGARGVCVGGVCVGGGGGMRLSHPFRA